VVVEAVGVTIVDRLLELVAQAVVETAVIMRLVRLEP